MCLIIAAPQGKQIPFDHIRRGFIRNPHGAGFMYAKDGELIVEKGFFSFNEFWSKIKKVNGLYPLTIHLRWGNVGPQNKINCHPWQISDAFAMVHNGTLTEYSNFNNSISDSGNFTNMVLRPMFNHNVEIWSQPFFVSILSKYLGYGKIVIMSHTGEYVIYNQNLGLNIDGIWYSNNDIRPLPKSMVKSTFKKTEKGAKTETTVTAS